MKHTAFKWMVIPALIAANTLAMAGESVRMYRDGEVPSASDVANILTGTMPATHSGYRPKMRGIRLDSAYKPDNRLEQGLAKVAEPQETAIGVPVKFAFNSAEIRPDYKPQLDAIANGIKMADGINVVVEGHTDAFGPGAYNEKLSLLRANAVKQYLISQHGITESKLLVRGYGESQPINEGDAFAAENRRVQFRAAK